MPIRPNSNLRKGRKHFHGWKGADGKYYVSVYPKFDNAAKNQYDTSRAALLEASLRHLPIKWEDPSVVS